jgi:hypothetical protein
LEELLLVKHIRGQQQVVQVREEELLSQAPSDFLENGVGLFRSRLTLVHLSYSEGKVSRKQVVLIGHNQDRDLGDQLQQAFLLSLGLLEGLFRDQFEEVLVDPLGPERHFVETLFVFEVEEDQNAVERTVSDPFMLEKVSYDQLEIDLQFFDVLFVTRNVDELGEHHLMTLDQFLHVDITAYGLFGLLQRFGLVNGAEVFQEGCLSYIWVSDGQKCESILDNA